MGYFERSKQLAQYPSATMTSVISKVTYPMLSKVQDDKQYLEKTFIKFNDEASYSIRRKHNWCGYQIVIEDQYDELFKDFPTNCKS